MAKKGFTLVEMVMVVAVLGILTAVAVPALSGLGGWPLKTEAREFAALIRETRLTAITHGVTCRIVFYQFSGSYRVEWPDGAKWEELPDGVYYAANNFPLVDGRPTLYFRYTGAPNSGGHVALKDEKGTKLYIIVTPVTGRVRVSSSPP